MFLRALLLILVFVFAAEAAPRVEIIRRGNFASSKLVEGRDGALYGWQYPGKIFRLAANGQFRIICDFGEEKWIEAIAVAGDGHLYCTFGSGELFRISYTGVPEEIWKSAGMPGFPRSLVTSLDENLHVLADNVFFRLLPNGTYEVLASVSDFEIWRIAEGADGSLWLAGRDAQAQWAMRRLSRDGMLDDPITAGALPGKVEGLFLTPDGSFFAIAEAGSGRVLLRITSSGEIEQGAPFPLAGLPENGVILHDGRLLYTAWDDAKVASAFCALAMDGSIETLAVLPRSMPFGLDYSHLLAKHDGTMVATAAGPWRGQTFQPGALLRLRGARAAWKNSPPLARGDFRRPPDPGKGMWINLLGNDSDLNRDPLVLTEVDQPLHGTVTADLARGRVYYTAPAGEPVLVDEFQYRIADGKGGVAVGRVVIRPNLRGSFASLIESESPEANGRIGVTLGNFGALTGHVWLGGRRESFAGSLDAANRFFLERSQGFVSGMTLRLELRADASGRPIVAAEIETPQGNFEAELSRPSLAAAASAAGAYTLVLPSDPAWAAEPEYLGGFNVPLRRNPIHGVQGHGIGTLRVSKNGLVTIAGTLPDGGPFAGGHVLDRGGQLPIFATFKARNGSPDETRKGWITGRTASGSANGAAGSARWIQPWATTAITQTESFFERSVDVVASRYLAPERLQSASWNTLQVNAATGGLPSAISASAQVSGNVLAGILPLRINGSFSPATGLVSGHVSFPGWGAWTSYRGVLLQNQGRILGQFKALSGRGTGRIAIEPR